MLARSILHAQWTWRAALKRTGEVLRQEGVKSLWFKILGETVYRRAILMERPLDQPNVRLAARLPVAIDLLRTSEVDEYANFRPDTDPSETRRRLEAGPLCFVARHEGRIVHACWAATGRAWVEYLAGEILLASDEVFHYDSFTAPSFRGRNIAAVRVIEAARYFRQAGYRRLVAIVVPENTSAFRSLEKAGYRRVGVIGYVKIGPWRWNLCRVHRRSRPQGEFASGPRSPAYWNDVLGVTKRGRPLDEWRSYMQRVYRRLVQNWFQDYRAGYSLKTDLFEEAISPYHLLPDLGSDNVGIDYSPAVVQMARERLTTAGNRHLFVVGDVRRIPLQSGTISRILSGSSLDHFPDKADIATSMAELARVLVCGGTLVITFDNPHNPIVWLRNHLPFAWLKRLHLVPYYVGATYDRIEARTRLEALGFTVTDATAVAHAPRLPAIWLAAVAQRLGRTGLRTLVAHILDGFETLEHWPTRYRTGYYLAFRAEKHFDGH
jgi:SAM-dependent methyltransferase/GNAT superfamily N-acetyltransferase